MLSLVGGAWLSLGAGFGSLVGGAQLLRGWAWLSLGAGLTMKRLLMPLTPALLGNMEEATLCV